MKHLILILILSLTSCSNIQTTIQWDDGSVFIIDSKKDALVQIEKDEKKVIVDNRGRPGFIEQVFGAFIVDDIEITEE